MIDIKLYDNGNAHIGADIALKSRLYVSGWNLSGELGKIRAERKTDNKVALLFKGNVCIAVAVLRRDFVQAFVRKQERRNGYGRMVVEKLGVSKSVDHGEGIDGSWKFWSSVLK